MNETSLNRLKNRALGLASSALLRVELAAEENRIRTKYQALGKKLYAAVRGDLLSAMKDDPMVVSLLGEIAEMQVHIAELKKEIAERGSGKDPSAQAADKDAAGEEVPRL